MLLQPEWSDVSGQYSRHIVFELFNIIYICDIQNRRNFRSKCNKKIRFCAALLSILFFFSLVHCWPQVCFTALIGNNSCV